jgi:hypothetical protein
MTKFNIRDGYYNIRIKPEDRWKATFKTPFGLFEPNVMPFGLTNALAAFQKFMDCIFALLKWKYPRYLFWFMDDIITATPDDKKLHEEIVREVLKVLRKESLHLKAKKCHFEQMEMEFLGYLITKGTIKIDPTKKTWVGRVAQGPEEHQRSTQHIGSAGISMAIYCKLFTFGTSPQ